MSQSKVNGYHRLSVMRIDAVDMPNKVGQPVCCVAGCGFVNGRGHTCSVCTFIHMLNL